MPKPHLSPVQRERIFAMHRQGFTHAAIADLFEIHPRTVVRNLAPKTRAESLSRGDVEQLLELVDELRRQQHCRACGAAVTLMPEVSPPPPPSKYPVPQWGDFDD